MPPRSTNTQQQQHVVASPNPTVDDGKTPAITGTKKVEATKAQPVQTTTEAPMQTTTTKSKSKPKHRRTKPRG
jgi:hypothetical protein